MTSKQKYLQQYHYERWEIRRSSSFEGKMTWLKSTEFQGLVNHLQEKLPIRKKEMWAWSSLDLVRATDRDAEPSREVKQWSPEVPETNNGKRQYFEKQSRMFVGGRRKCNK